MSRGCLLILAAIAIFVLVVIILAATSVISWLNALTDFSYVKLFITLIKYVPQAYMNYRFAGEKLPTLNLN